MLRLHGELSPGEVTYLADTTPPAFEGILLVFSVILFNLLCEESVEDLVDQLGGGSFSRTFVLLLGGMTDGLTSLSSPGREVLITLARYSAFSALRSLGLLLLHPYLFPRVTPANLIRSLMQGVRKMGCSSLSPAAS